MKFEMQSEMELGAQHVLRTIIAANGQAYYVGGYVRNRILNRKVKDIDIATSLAPETVLALFKNVIPTGLQHGTVTVRWNKISYEVTTFRTDGTYQDFRRPEQVFFVDRLEDDLMRRDFTINAMAISNSGELVDPFGGYEDARKRMVRCVGNAHERFQEDALRMMRCIRFSVQLGFDIEDQTWQALLALRENMKYIAMERIRVEFEQMIGSADPAKALNLLAESAILTSTRETLPYKFIITERLESAAMQINQIGSFEARWIFWAWLVQLDAKQLQTQLSLLTCSKHHVQLVTKGYAALLESIQLIRNDETIDEMKTKWQLLAIRYGIDTAKRIIEIFSSIDHADIWFKQRNHDHEALTKQYSAYLQQVIPYLRDWMNEIRIWSASELVLRGNEIATSVNRNPGAWLSDLIIDLVNHVGLGRIENDKEALYDYARKWSDRKVDDSTT